LEAKLPCIQRDCNDLPPHARLAHARNIMGVTVNVALQQTPEAEFTALSVSAREEHA